MAKKTIISDFSALKGKVSFSEKAALTAVEAEIKQDCIKESDERALKVGQKVIMMDSNLHGTIISLGKTVGIEVEDGLKIRATYGEFAVSDDQERTALKESKIKAKKTIHHGNKPQRTSASGTLTIDLHIEAIPGGRNIPKGQQLEFQMDTFKRAVRENLPRRGLKICFIHGLGDGILKAAIRKELDEVLALRCSYTVGDPAVTVVTIK